MTTVKYHRLSLAILLIFNLTSCRESNLDSKSKETPEISILQKDKDRIEKDKQELDSFIRVLKSGEAIDDQLMKEIIEADDSK